MPSPSDHSAASITSRSFAVRRKGFDPDEVRAYLGQLAEVISRLSADLDGARGEISSLKAAAEARPEIDEEQLTEVLGEETARVLSSARHAATDIKERAEESAAVLRREAAEEAGRTRRDADADAARVREESATVRLEADEARRLAIEEAETTAARWRAETEAEAEAVRTAVAEEQRAAEATAETVRAEAEVEAVATRAAAEAVLGERTAEADKAAAALVEQGEADGEARREQAEAEAAAIRTAAEGDKDARHAEGREMVAEAQRVRKRMLADLARRRKAARVQLEQLQAGRDRLLESYEAVQRQLDAATSGLRVALPEARQAAETARIRAEGEPADTLDQLEAQISAARNAGMPLVAPEGVDDDEADEAADDLSDPADPTRLSDEDPVDLLGATHDALGATNDSTDTGTVDTGTVPAVGGPGRGDESEAAATELSSDVDLAGLGAGLAGAGPKEVDPAVSAPGDGPAAGGEPPPEDVEAVTVATAAASTLAVDARAQAGEGTAEGEEVESLFARLRASRQGSEDDLAPEGDAPSPDAAAELDPDAPGSDIATGPSSDADSDTTPAVPPAAVGADEVSGAGDPDLLELLERRDGAIEPIEGRVARRLKRVLADEQGRVLDGVRRAKDSPGLEEVLPADEQVAAYAAAATDDLLAAAEEGAAFEGASLPTAVSIATVAEELGRSLAAVVRPRIERCFEAGEDPEDTSDRLRATYREWKTDSLVDATRHHVLAAFGEGQCAVRPSGSPVRWVPDPTTPACPDCEDDALAGSVPSGDSFPTGHSHPPAHPGCRCLVIGERVGVPA